MTVKVNMVYNSNIQQNDFVMFEIQSKKSGRLSLGSKNNSTSRSKLSRKEQHKPSQKIVLEVIKTDGYPRDSSLKQKNKSQCFSKEILPARKSIDASKFIKTTRSFGSKKSRQKTQKSGKGTEQILTQTRHKHENFTLSNLVTQKSTQMKWVKKSSSKKSAQGLSVERKKIVWNEKQIPYDCQYVLEFFSHHLTKYEQNQIRQYKKVYYLGHKAAKSQRIDGVNMHFDNQEKQYNFIENDHIAYRYEIISLIGTGSYGQVFRVYDHKHKEEVALKMVKNDPKFSKQAFTQIKILSHIKQNDNEQQSNVVRIKDFVVFRKHVCIIFELLSSNLYQLIIRNNYNGLSEELIRRFAIQILISLQFLRNQKIIHCDLKPENILLKEFNKSGLKLIDFGSSCFENKTIYTYIQSRYYRAPQITLGIPYNHHIDIWSTGCIFVELYTGVPVFPGENQLEQMKYMTDTLGLPPRHVLNKGSRKSIFFDETGKVKPQIKSLQTTMDMFSKPLSERIQDKDFLQFIECFLKWDPNQRITPLQALNHSWISKGLPQELRTKLSGGNQQMLKMRPKKERSGSKMKGKSSKQKNSSTTKITHKASQQKLKKSYGLKN